MNNNFSTLQHLLTQFKVLHIKRRTGATFLEIARFPHRETVWSNILAFYLDPKREHNLHDLLLKSVFEAIGQHQPEWLNNLRSVEVETEVATLAGNRIDIVVAAEHFVLGIENKVKASLYNDLEDYGATLDSYSSGQVVYKVVLSRYPVAPGSGFVNLTYAQLVRAVRSNLGVYTDYADGKYLLFLLDFLKTIEKHHNPSVVMENPEVVRFLQQHAESVEELVKHHHQLQDELVRQMDRVDQVLQERLYATNGLASELVAQGGQLKGEGGRQGRFTWQGKQLIKYIIVAGGVTAYVQVGLVKGYKLRVHYWAHNNPQMEQQLASGGLKELYFTLDDADEQIEEAVLAQLEKMRSVLVRANSVKSSSVGTE